MAGFFHGYCCIATQMPASHLLFFTPKGCISFLAIFLIDFLTVLLIFDRSLGPAGQRLRPRALPEKQHFGPFISNTYKYCYTVAAQFPQPPATGLSPPAGCWRPSSQIRYFVLLCIYLALQIALERPWACSPQGLVFVLLEWLFLAFLSIRCLFFGYQGST